MKLNSSFWFPPRQRGEARQVLAPVIEYLRTHPHDYDLIGDQLGSLLPLVAYYAAERLIWAGSRRRARKGEKLYAMWNVHEARGWVLDMWVKASYQLGIDPLPTLRRLYPRKRWRRLSAKASKGPSPEGFRMIMCLPDGGDLVLLNGTRRVQSRCLKDRQRYNKEA